MLAQRLNITLPYELARNLKRCVPLRKRSQFIAQAITEKLTKADLSKQLRKSALAQREIIKQIQEDFEYADAETWANLP